LSAPDREAIAALQARRDWIWISGNHDPALRPISAAWSPAKCYWSDRVSSRAEPALR